MVSISHNAFDCKHPKEPQIDHICVNEPKITSLFLLIFCRVGYFWHWSTMPNPDTLADQLPGEDVRRLLGLEMLTSVI